MRRGSIEAGTFEDNFFAKPAKGECDRLIRMARVALATGRRMKREARGEGRDLTGPERLLAGLTAGPVRVYEELCAVARLNGGKVYPSYDRLTTATYSYPLAVQLLVVQSRHLVDRVDDEPVWL